MYLQMEISDMETDLLSKQNYFDKQMTVVV